MSPPSANQATSGIAADFVVDRVRRHESHRGAYFAFQMDRPESVRIFDPAERGRHVECTCEEFQSSQVICIHIYWLFDGLNAVLRTRRALGTQDISTGDVLAQISALYGLIGSRLSSLPTLLSATRDEISSDTDDATDAIGSPAFSDTRAEQVRDMLSVFDTAALPEDYDPGNASTTAGNEQQNLYVPNNLPATIFQIAVRDGKVFESLRTVITHDICANTHFSKLRTRAREAFARLDSYIENGPSDDAETADQDIPRCAKMLRIIVDQICQFRDSRASSGPLSAPVKRRVAEILVEILQEVCNRNEDIYYRIGWEREMADGEPDRNRNLYAYLIDDPPRSNSSTPDWMKETFVIDRLRQTPTDEWRHLIERLTSIVDQMRERMEDEDDPPLAYTKLERMIQEYTAEAFEPSSSSVQRRPTLGSHRQRQRRRFE
ncbi:MAG: hypothetical protein L6R38_000669 [Xanthoria sp. 2 TBL-2021]|nr:MAG: hypothetical protein L6R38_000669 [Xanthoria sp. 2 TBL-2021]